MSPRPSSQSEAGFRNGQESWHRVLATGLAREPFDAAFAWAMFMRKERAQNSQAFPLHLERSVPALRTTSIIVGRMLEASRYGATGGERAKCDMAWMDHIRASPSLSSLAMRTSVSRSEALVAMLR